MMQNVGRCLLLKFRMKFFLLMLSTDPLSTNNLFNFSYTIYSNWSFLCISHSLFCWDDQSVTAGKKCQHCPAGQGNLNALVLSETQAHHVTFPYQYPWQKLHFLYLSSLCYLCYPATLSSGGSVCLWDWRTTTPPFLVNPGTELQQLLLQSPRDISKQLFFWHQARTFLEAQLFLLWESSTSPHLLWAAFRCQRWRLLLQESSTVTFSE